MAPLTLLLRLVVLAGLLACAGCGSSEDVELDVASPLASAEISSYTGWFPGPWHEEIWIRLEEGVELSGVAGLSIFGKLRPGMSLAEAAVVAGEPASQFVDYRGTKWSRWSRDRGSLKVGCAVSCSGDDCYSAWELWAEGRDLSSAEGVFIPAIVDIVRKAEAKRPEVEYRAVHVQTYDYSDKLTLTLISDWETGLWWGKGAGVPCRDATETSAPAPAASGG